MINVAYKEIFELVGHGFNDEYLEKMPISLRRFYFKLHQDKLQAESGQKIDPNQDGKRITFDPVKSDQ